MFKKKIDFNKCFKPVLIGYAVFMVIALVLTLIFGVNLSIDFKGGTRIAYSYVGDVDTDKADASPEALRPYEAIVARIGQAAQN